MMDMEMNADLGDDDGSESSQSSSEGSSASSTFCGLEKDYARILEEMRDNEALARYMSEYTNLFESLYTAHRTEKELSEQCLSLKEEVAEGSQKMEELKRSAEANAQEIERLRLEVANAVKLADAAHARELNAHEIIENLRVNVSRLNQELEVKSRQIAAEGESSVTKQKEGLLKEKEKLQGELETLRQRMKNMSVYTEELERRAAATEQRIGEMQELLETRSNEVSKERRAKQRAEAELSTVQDELTGRTNELEAVNESMRAATANVARLEAMVKEQKTSGEKMEKEINKLMVKRANLQTDYDNVNQQNEILEKELTERDKHLKNARQSLNRARDENARSKSEKESMEKRLQKSEAEKASLDEQLKQALAKSKNADCENMALRKQLIAKQQYIEVLQREKGQLAKAKETSKGQIKRMNNELVVCEHTRKKIEHQLDETMHTMAESKKRMEAVEKERDKFNLETQELADKVEECMNEAKLKQIEIFDYKKRLAEAEARHRQQLNLFEIVRAERNSYSKSLIEAQDEILELKSKLKIVGHQVEQVKEDIATKEADLVKKDFLVGRLEKEKETTKLELQATRKEVSDVRREIEDRKREEKRLRDAIRKADLEIGRQRKNTEDVQNERDILGGQLVRRNDELSVQYGRIKVLNGTLERGEAQYNQRLEDIRLLRLEIGKLRTEKTLLTKSIENTSDLREEIFHLNRDLTRERLKVVALEEELQTPLNIHRWRKLQGSDPGTYELLKKIQVLQKRLIRMSAEMVEKDMRIKDTEKLYANLREMLSRQPGPQVAITLEKTRKALCHRGKRMKCLVAELSMYEVQMDEQRLDTERMAEEIRDLKRKYYAEKRKQQRSRIPSKPMTAPPSLPTVTNQTKYLGGGFSLTAPTSRNYVTLESGAR